MNFWYNLNIDLRLVECFHEITKCENNKKLSIHLNCNKNTTFYLKA